MTKQLSHILLFILLFPSCMPNENVTTSLEYPKMLNQSIEQLINHKGYTVSYNPDRLIPNWAAYSLMKEKLNGTVPKDKGFYADPSVGDRTAKATDYKKSGYSRGHMAPAGDMKWDATAMHESCYYSNICPQNMKLNSGVWNVIENKVRKLANKCDVVYVVCGPIVPQKHQTIGANKVAVPSAFFKAILVCDKREYKSIAFICDNADLEGDCMQYATSVDSVESLLKMDLFYNLPDEIEDEVEARYVVDIMEY